MQDVLTEFRDALVDASETGEPLVAFQGNIWSAPGDMEINESTTFPLMILRAEPGLPSDVTRGSRILVHEGTIFVAIHVQVERENASSGYETARAACEVHRANLERVLCGLRSLVTAGQPMGCWTRMRFESVGEGPAATGLFDIQGIIAYRYVVACVFRFARTRAA